MTREELDFIGSMNMCDEISNEAYKKIVCHCEEQEPCEDAIGRSDMLDAIGHGTTYSSEELQKIIKGLPPVNPQQWETCFDCPLSHGCPKIKGCTNEQAMEYASKIPNDCPLSAQPERKTDGDTISRQAVLDKKELIELEDGQSFYCISPEDVETLPSVNSQPKTGHWINIDATHSKCDRCEAVFEIASENGEVNYCPNCGAKMIDLPDRFRSTDK